MPRIGDSLSGNPLAKYTNSIRTIGQKGQRRSSFKFALSVTKIFVGMRKKAKTIFYVKVNKKWEVNLCRFCRRKRAAQAGHLDPLLENKPL
ncbi:hypothetical protein CEXT_591551 [Caerostris extrusa]|uniref:Uncharacterized protein n=1 Tax=Caerostris extrusa TaxID=172846 RepID=A0AAV4VWZ0_CAEEX|nr:hypothetical protein CEXT_591551 [Caerostris extrusa]